MTGQIGDKGLVKNEMKFRTQLRQAPACISGSDRLQVRVKALPSQFVGDVPVDGPPALQVLKVPKRQVGGHIGQGGSGMASAPFLLNPRPVTI